MNRSEFSKTTKLAAFERAAGHCEVCTAPLTAGRIEYDHIIPCGLGGTAELSNCKVTCRNCHAEKTYRRDLRAIAKSRRIRFRGAGILKPRIITGWKRFDGTPVRASRER